VSCARVVENVAGARLADETPPESGGGGGETRATNGPPFYLNDVFSSSLILKRLQYI